jgi:sugar/nucleoside kinase (ribokinase family)
MSRKLVSHQKSAPQRYLLIGGACLETFSTTASVALGGKNRVRTRLRAVGGGGVNVAFGLKAQDPEAEVVLLAGTGEDPAGEAVRGGVAERRVAMPWGVLPGQPTSASLIVGESESGRSTIFSEIGARAEPVPLGLVEELLPGCDGCWLVAPTRKVCPTRPSTAPGRFWLQQGKTSTRRSCPSPAFRSTVPKRPPWRSFPPACFD